MKFCIMLTNIHQLQLRRTSFSNIIFTSAEDLWFSPVQGRPD